MTRLRNVDTAGLLAAFLVIAIMLTALVTGWTKAARSDAPDVIDHRILQPKSIQVIDGDTVRLHLSGERPVTVRLLGGGAPGVAGFDAPEIERSQCAAERAKGEAAAEALRGLLPRVTHVVWPVDFVLSYADGARDGLGRPLVTLKLDNGYSAGAELMARGLATTWLPGPKDRARRKALWCGEGG